MLGPLRARALPAPVRPARPSRPGLALAPARAAATLAKGKRKIAKKQKTSAPPPPVQGRAEQEKPKPLKTVLLPHPYNMEIKVPANLNMDHIARDWGRFKGEPIDVSLPWKQGEEPEWLKKIISSAVPVSPDEAVDEEMLRPGALLNFSPSKSSSSASPSSPSPSSSSTSPSISLEKWERIAEGLKARAAQRQLSQQKEMKDPREIKGEDQLPKPIPHEVKEKEKSRLEAKKVDKKKISLQKKSKPLPTAPSTSTSPFPAPSSSPSAKLPSPPSKAARDAVMARVAHEREEEAKILHEHDGEEEELEDEEIDPTQLEEFQLPPKKKKLAVDPLEVKREDLILSLTVAGRSTPVGPLVISLLVSTFPQAERQDRFLASRFKETLNSDGLRKLLQEDAVWSQTNSLQAEEVDLRLQNGQSVDDMAMQTALDMIKDLKKTWLYLRPHNRWQPFEIQFGAFSPATVEKYAKTWSTVVPSARFFHAYGRQDLPQAPIEVAFLVAEQERQEMLREIERMNRLSPNALGSGDVLADATTQSFIKQLVKETTREEEFPDYIRRSWNLLKAAKAPEEL